MRSGITEMHSIEDEKKAGINLIHGLFMCIQGAQNLKM